MNYPMSHVRLIVVQDQPQPCPYLPDTTARMPLQLPVGQVNRSITDRLLAMGYRRSGDFVYRTHCPTCDQCRPTRVNVAQFELTRSLRRIFKLGERELEASWGSPQVDDQRVEIFNRHRILRGLGEDHVNAESYRAFLIDSCCDTRELSIFYKSQRVASSIVDVGNKSLSAVYTYFDPDFARYSLGTYAILKQLQWAASSGRRWVYLGMYVADNPHLNYKSRFQPQQRLIEGQWVDVAKPSSQGEPSSATGPTPVTHPASPNDSSSNH